MSKNPSPRRQRNDNAKKVPGNRTQNDLPLLAADEVKGGSKPEGSLDAGIHFKYDIKANKEA
jgi:hypothetical protein